MAAIFIYGSSAQTPQELCESLGGSLPCWSALAAAGDLPGQSVEMQRAQQHAYNKASTVRDDDSPESIESATSQSGLLAGREHNERHDAQEIANGHADMHSVRLNSPSNK